MKKCVKTAINTVLSTALVMLIIGCWTLVGVKASNDTTYTFSDYRETKDKDSDGNWIDVPQQDGYVFAGWYDTGGNAAPIDATKGDYTAKFVKEDVLSLKLQLKSSKSTDPVTSKTSEADLRLITSVDTLDYSSVGFKVTGKVTKTYISNVVYQTIKGYTYTDENQVEQTYTPKAFSEDSNYFVSHIVQGADNTADSHDATDQFGTTLKVVPQWTTLDGTLVYGVERSFEINDGIEEYVAEIDEVNGSGEKGDHVWYTTLGDAVTDANGSAKNDAVTIGLLRDFSLNTYVTTSRDISIQNVTAEDITVSRGDSVTDYRMINHYPSETGTLTIGTNDNGAAKIIFNANDSAEIQADNNKAALYNQSTGTMYLNKNVTVKNVKTTIDTDHGAGGLNNYGNAYVSATFEGCEGRAGGAIYSTGATLEFDGTIKNCKAYQGAGIDTTVALDMTGGSITNCESTMYGGAIYGGGNAIINVTDGTIDNCEAILEGGAIRAATVNFTGGTVQNCNAPKGAGIRLYQGDIKGKIDNCDTTDTSTEGNIGGALYGIGGKVTLTSATIQNCDAYQGGAVYVESGSVTLASGTIKDCTATQFGGGIHAIADTTVNINGGSIDNCDSLGTTTNDSRGGGVYSLGTVKMTDGTIQSCDAARAGGIFVDATTLTMSNGKILTCKAINGEGGAIYGSGSATVNFNGGSIEQCAATGHGGAIRLTKGTVKGKIVNCTATSNGGGVYVTGTGATVTMTGATLQNCGAKQGGGVYLTEGTFTLSSGDITKCTATSNGGGVYLTKGTFELQGGTITECTASTNGGAFFEEAGTITMSDGDITGCSSKAGGAVYQGGGSFTMTGGIIDACTTTGSGGAVCSNIAGASFTMTSGTISNCTATSTGGALHGATNATITVTGGTIYNCSSTSSNGGAIRIITGEIGGTAVIDSCTAPAGYGGGVIFDGANAASIPAFTGATIQNCSAKYGGGVAISFNAATKEMTMSDGLIQNCSATVGGGAIAFEEPSILTLTGGDIKNCTSTKQGGGIYEGKGTSTLNLEGVIIDNCDSTGANETDARGGGVYACGPVNMSAGTITNGNAYKGAGIYMGAATGVLTMSGGEITNCVSVEQGGALYGEGSATIGFNGGTIKACQSVLGGGIRLSKGNIGGDIQNCKAVAGSASGTSYDGFGGGVYAAGAITMTGTVKDCTAHRGAGVYTSTTFTMTSGSITNCDSKEHGAGIYGTGAAVINFNGGTISSCDSEIGSGGGIRLSSGTIKGTISNCTAKNGGALFMDGTTPSVTVAGGTISGCTATSQGGGVYVNQAGVLTMSSGSVTGCTGTVRGGGLYLESTADFTMTGGSLTANHSGAWGGAIFAAQDNIVTLTAGTISGNTSTHADIYGTNNAIQATQCGTTTQVTLGSEFDMGADSLHFTGVTERTTPVLKITGTSLTNHSATNPLYIAMSDNQPGLVEIQCDSNAAATSICAALKSADSKAVFTVNDSVIETKNIAIASMTFNVLGSGKEGEGFLSPSVRAPHVYSYLKNSGMDLIGIQEAQEGTYDWQAGFKNNLSSTYGMVRITDQSGSPSTIGIENGLIILYNTDRFTLVSSGLQQYSSDSGRYFQWAKFTDNYTNKTVYMTNTHWTVLKNSDGSTNSTDSSSARVTQANELLSFWKNTVGSNILIATGDYNSLPTLTEFTILSGGIYKSTDTVLGDIKTDRIDHIFINPNLTHAHAYHNGTLKFTHTDGAEYMMSDHAPRIATILVK